MLCCASGVQLQGTSQTLRGQLTISASNTHLAAGSVHQWGHDGRELCGQAERWWRWRLGLVGFFRGSASGIPCRPKLEESAGEHHCIDYVAPCGFVAHHRQSSEVFEEIVQAAMSCSSVKANKDFDISKNAKRD